MVGGGKAPELCAALWKRQQNYLSMDRSFQTEGGFISAVHGDGKRPEPGSIGAATDPSESGDGTIEIEPLPFDNGLDEDKDMDIVPDKSDTHNKEMDTLNEEKEVIDAHQASDTGDARSGSVQDGQEADAAAVVAAMSSPKQQQSTEDGTDGSLAATRARRTPKRPTPHDQSEVTTAKRTPGSTGKRTRHDDIYEYYDEGMNSLTESTRKRRSQKRLDFEMYNPAPSRRRREADEQKGLEALLALAGGDDESEDAKRLSNASFHSFASPTYARAGALQGSGVQSSYSDRDEEEEEEDDDILGASLDDERDEDFSLRRTSIGSRRSSHRRTPNTTPSKSRSKTGGRSASAHTTPRRQSVRSPGGGILGSPGWMGIGEADYLGDFYGDQPMLMLGSPGGPSTLPSGIAPSPQNPMPRLRRRKHPPEVASALLTPLRGLFGRHTGRVAPMPGTAALSVLTHMNIPGVASVVDPGPAQNAPELELKLRHCLNVRTRRWAFFEFFYSAIDRSWFMSDGLDALARHCGIPPKAKLTRREWSVLRSMLGRPRRLSLAFLREQRAKLEAHRQRSRASYSMGTSEGNVEGSESRHEMEHLPGVIPVGARVVARHPTTRALHDGSILTLGANSYRVQFDRQELGVELVRDIDVMPVEPWVCLPPAMLERRRELVLNGRVVIDGMPVVPPQKEDQTQPPVVIEPSGPIPDVGSMAKLMAALDRKEAILSQLRAMNDEAAAGVHTVPGGSQGTLSPAFVQSYADLTHRLEEMSRLVQEHMDAVEKGPGVTFAVELCQAAAATTSVLPAALQYSPVTPLVLQTWAQHEATEVVNASMKKLDLGKTHEGRSEEGQVKEPAEEPLGIDGSGPKDDDLGPLRPMIEGAIQTMLVLKAGADRIVPANSVASALNDAVLSVKPKSVANAGVYTEVEHIIAQIKQSLTAE